MDTEAIEQHVVKCSCLTKTPEVKYHQPWCSYRQVATLKERIEALEAALTEATDGVFVCDDDFPISMPQYLYDKLKALLPGSGE